MNKNFKKVVGGISIFLMAMIAVGIWGNSEGNKVEKEKISKEVTQERDVYSAGVQDAMKSNDSLQEKSSVSTGRKKAKQSKKKYTEKENIFYKMLNSVDYYDTAEGSFSTVLGEEQLETEVEFISDLEEATGYEGVENKTVDTELYVADGTRQIFNNEEETYVEDTEVIEQEMEIPTDEDRIVEENDGSKTYNYREKISNLANADMVLAPQEITFSFLGDFSLWKIVGQEKYLGRKCVKIKGTTEEYYRQKLDVAKFTFWVDAETGFLLKYEGYNEKNELTDYIKTEEITINQPVKEKKASKKKYKNYKKAEHHIRTKK